MYQIGEGGNRYDIRIIKLIQEGKGKYTYLAEIIGGKLFLDSANEANQDVIDLAWIDLNDSEKFVSVTTPILELYLLR